MTDHRPSAFGVFARTHLRSAAERAIFAVVASAAGHWWSAAAAARAARQAHVTEHETDQTLRRFAAAGIVEQRADADGRRYRYRAEMAYLHDDTDLDDELRDPVCGMPVAADAPHTANDDEGHTVRFCSILCLLRWQRARRRSRY
jgi:YHS domain-containing protein